MARAKSSLAEMFLPRARQARPTAKTSGDNPAMQAIWEAVAMIPRGKISTYAAVARAAALPGRARLTGLALKIAPRHLHLPWQRVLGAGGRIVFPRSSVQHRQQARLLRAEGVSVKNGRADRACLIELEER